MKKWWPGKSVSCPKWHRKRAVLRLGYGLISANIFPESVSLANLECELQRL